MLRSASPEVELLVRCVHPSGKFGEVDSVRELLAGDLDWEQLLELGEAHGVTPLLHQTLTAQRQDRSKEATTEDLERTVPESVHDRLAEQVRSIAVRNVHITTEMQTLLDSFEEHDIRALPFKGPVLAAFAYGDVGFREFGDLDLLVCREDITEAVDVLESHGYTWEDVPRLDDSALLGGPFTKALVPEYELHRENLTVEVRWRVGDPDRPFPPSVDTLWKRRETVEVAGTDVDLLAPEDRLLVLAFHGTKHNWHLLKWVCDFAATLEQTDVVWSRLLGRARQHRVERKLLVGIALVDGLFGADIPVWVRDRLVADQRAIPLAEQVVEGFCSGTPTRPTRAERITFNARASDSVGDSLRAVLYHSRFHPGEPEYQLLPLSGPLHPLYYLVLPVRLLADRSLSLRRDAQTEYTGRRND